MEKRTERDEKKRAVSPKETRAARAYLFKRRIPPTVISPLRFAAAARELNMGYRDLIKSISLMYAQGQNSQHFRRDYLRKAK